VTGRGKRNEESRTGGIITSPEEWGMKKLTEKRGSSWSKMRGRERIKKKERQITAMQELYFNEKRVT